MHSLNSETYPLVVMEARLVFFWGLGENLPHLSWLASDNLECTLAWACRWYSIHVFLAYFFSCSFFTSVHTSTCTPVYEPGGQKRALGTFPITLFLFFWELGVHICFLFSSPLSTSLEIGVISMRRAPNVTEMLYLKSGYHRKCP